MDVGVYFDLRNPPGWRQDWSRLYGFTIEAIEEAERLGVKSVWLSEHHGFEDGYLNQPLTYAAAVAARTRTIRIGTAVLIAPFWNPVQLAEEAAVVDIVSGGRLELGIGAGYRFPEFDLFGVDRTKRYSLTDGAVRRIREIWADPGLLPHPVQQRLPIWMGYAGPQGARRAGRLGEGLLYAGHELMEPYRAGLAEGGHDPDSARVSGPVFAYVTEDPERDWDLVAKHHSYQMDTYLQGFADGTDQPAPPPTNSAKYRERGIAGGLFGLGYGTPESIAAEIVERFAGLPVHHLLFWTSLAGMPEEMVMRHVQALAKLQTLLADSAP